MGPRPEGHGKPRRGQKTPLRHRPQERKISREVPLDDLDLLGRKAVLPIHDSIDQPVDLPDPQKHRRKLLHRRRKFAPQVLASGPRRRPGGRGRP